METEKIPFLKYESFSDFVDLTTQRIAKNFKNPSILKNKKFNEWMLSKEKLCRDSESTFFDASFWYRCYFILEYLKDDKDFMMLFLGEPGDGKSTLLAQMCAVINPNYCLKYVCYNFNDYNDAIQIHQKYDTYHLDEGALILNSLDKSKNAVTLDQLSAIMREFNLFMGMCFVDFKQIRRHFREARIHNMIYVLGRGKHLYLTKDAVDKFREEVLSGNNNIKNMKFPPGSTWQCNNTNAIPVINDITKESYLARKRMNSQRFLNQLNKISEKDKPQLEAEPSYSATKTAKILHLSQKKVLNLIYSGSLKASKYPDSENWIVPKSEVERFLKSITQPPKGEVNNVV